MSLIESLDYFIALEYCIELQLEVAITTIKVPFWKINLFK